MAAGTYKMHLAGGIDNYTPLCSGNCTSNVALPNSFGIGNAVTNLSINSDTTQNFTLPLVTLSGKTKDSNGIAIGNVVVNLSLSAYFPYGYTGNDSVNYYSNSNTTSDVNGNYSVPAFAAELIQATLVPPISSGLARMEVTNINVSTNTNCDFTLQPAFTLSGKITTSEGVGVSNIMITFAGTPTIYQMTDADGNYSITLAAGSYSISLSGGSYSYSTYCGGYCTSNVALPKNFWISNAVGSVAINSNTTLNYTLPLVTLSGKTKDSNGVTIGNVLLNQSGQPFSSDGRTYYCSNNEINSPIESDANGNYSMTLLASLGLQVSLVPPTSSGLVQTTVKDINVLTNTTYDFTIQAGLTLSGKVSTAGGVGISKIIACVQDNQFFGETIGCQATDADGNYSISLAAGTYKMYLLGGSNYPSTLCGGYCTSNVALPKVFWINDATSNLAIYSNTLQNFTLPLVTLNGKTTDSNGVAVGNVVINQRQNSEYYPNEGITSENWYSSNNEINSPIKSDDNGNYSMTLLPVTGVQVNIMPPTGSGFAQTLVNSMDLTKSTLLNILLDMPDTKAPVILSGPKVSAYSDTTATIEWQTNEPAKGGVIYSTSSPPTTPVVESVFKTTHSLPLTGLTANTTYYIQVIATDTTGNGPTSSQIINFTTKPTPDITDPVILTGPTITTITHTSAVVEWTTNEPSTGSVEYGLASVPDMTVVDLTLTTSHRVILTGLTPQTVYYLNTTATDAVNNGPTASPVISFRTVDTPDIIAPIIVEGPMVINISDTGSSVVWKTDEPATSGVSWNDGTAHDLVTDDTTLTTNHSVRLTGLTASTEYSYTVSSKDDVSNGPTLSVAKTFTTLPLSDTNAPVITESPLVVNVTHQSAVIRWRTDEPADGVIEYGTLQTFGSSESHAVLTQPHNMTLTGLSSGTLYYFRVASKDAAGNGPTYSATGTFTTDDHDKDKIPVVTVTPEIIHKDNDKGVVYWETDEPCDTVVDYGEGSELTDRHSDGEKVTKHQTTITNLKANTSYNVQVSCTDMEGHKVVAKAGTPSTFMAFNMANILSDAMINATGATGFMTKSLPDTTDPVITVTPAAISISGTQATITWTTDEIADSQVKYNLSGQAFNLTAGDITKVFSHSIVLTNLTPEMTYDFTVTSVDPSGNLVTSVVYSFTTTVHTNAVSFNSDGGSPVTTQNVANNSTATAPGAPTKTGFNFAGWYSDVTLISAFSFSTTITSDITLYAKWSTPYTLTVMLAGNGGGSVHSSPVADISCIKGATNGCTGIFSADVTLTAVPESTTSAFSGWNNVCETTLTQKECVITMTSDKSAVATFTLAPKSKLDLAATTGYDTLQTAYSNAESTIFALDGLFTGAWTLDQSKNITLKGGYLADFGPTRDGFTILSGKLTIKTGSLRVDGLKVRP